MKFRRRLLKYLCFVAAIAAALLLWSFILWRREISVWLVEISHMLEDFSVDLRSFLDALDGIPLIFYSLAIFILPIFFLPATPIYIVAASRAVEGSYLLVLLYCYLGITLNILLSYFISRRFGRFLRRKLEERKVKIPEIPEYEQYELTFLIRMIPGNPLAVQNYALGLADIPFFKYIAVSLPIQYAQVAVYVWFGEGIFEGGLSKIILGISTLLVLALLARMLEKRYGYKLRRLRFKNKDGKLSEK